MTLPYREGTWFAVPLRYGGYGVGVVARTTDRGRVLLGYFFGPRREVVPALNEVCGLLPQEAVRVVRFGDLALVSEEWPIIGHATPWDRQCWPLPSFVRRDEISGTAWKVEYSDDDPNKVVAEVAIKGSANGLERDAVLGAGALELVLTQSLNS
jgi:hypothetical protein